MRVAGAADHFYLGVNDEGEPVEEGETAVLWVCWCSFGPRCGLLEPRSTMPTPGLPASGRRGRPERLRSRLLDERLACLELTDDDRELLVAVLLPLVRT